MPLRHGVQLDSTGKETVLYSFTGKADGAFPYAVLTRDAAGNLYGTTQNGDLARCGSGIGCGGVVFKLDTTGKETVLHRFTGKSGDGANPDAGVIRDAAGNLYGTTYYGGDLNCGFTGGCGTVFKLDTTGKETVLYTFTDAADGAQPFAGVIRDAAGNLYGTTQTGGTSGNGTVFKLNSAGKETVLYIFTGAADGAQPFAGVIRDAAGSLYGTTQHGGAFGLGTVFKLYPTGKETVLYSFSGGADGSTPAAALVRDAAGNLYGTTVLGGDPTCGCGTVFRIEP